jgi:colicin import membrane protein
MVTANTFGPRPVPGKLKTFITNLGFFELAVAAPSMKAALEAWGLNHNIFQHGFAKQTGDAKTVAAALAKPGVVLRRPVGTKGAFKENTDTPKAIPVRKATPAKAAPKKSASATTRPPANDKARVISFEKERKRRDQERAAEEAAEERAQERQERAIEKAQAALDAARQQHDDALAELSAAREKLDRREQLQNDRWDNQRERLEAALQRAKDS